MLDAYYCTVFLLLHSGQQWLSGPKLAVFQLSPASGAASGDLLGPLLFGFLCRSSFADRRFFFETSLSLVSFSFFFLLFFSPLNHSLFLSAIRRKPSGIASCLVQSLA
jgi:hypothetical protein